jgi:hypothetical protein
MLLDAHPSDAKNKVPEAIAFPVMIPCGVCREGTEEEPEYYRFRYMIAIPEIHGYLDPSDWVAEVVSCPQCSYEVPAEQIHDCILEAFNEAVLAWSKQTKWKNMDPRGWVPSTWGGHCAHMAEALTGFIPGSSSRCGYYHGDIHAQSQDYYGWLGNGHSWIELADGRVLDPTRFAFGDALEHLDEDAALEQIMYPTPRIYVGRAHDDEYERPGW